MNNTKKKRPSKSIFALILKQLLDETNYYKRSEWAEFLGITTPAISQWVNDKTLPRPDLIRMILDVLRTKGSENTASIIREFEELMTLPPEEISPLGSRMNPNLGEYLKEGSFIRFGNQLRGLSPEQQVSLINSGAWSEEATKKTATINDEPHLAMSGILQMPESISSLLPTHMETTDKEEVWLNKRLARRQDFKKVGEEIKTSSNRMVVVLPAKKTRELVGA